MDDTAATEIMHQFAARTGLTGVGPQQRYLWTDAFAVCNFLGLTEEPTALALIDAVHHTLGQHRDDDPRKGWISGLDAEEAEAHPTAGGLRIGKPLPERGVDEAPDPRLEWDQDGQYFHYLTRWMHALDQTAWATRNPVYNRWARELAAVAFHAFSYQPEPARTHSASQAPQRTSWKAPRRLFWKMSIDLSRPLVPAMGHHDPLDGYITCLQLQSSAYLLGSDGTELAFSTLADETEELARMIDGGDWATDDALGLGGLMTDAYRLFQIERRGWPAPEELLPALVDDAWRGLANLTQHNAWRMPAERRLAFRELGLAIGLKAMQALYEQVSTNGLSGRRGLASRLAPIARQGPLADRLVQFWRHPDNQLSDTWTAHEDINAVMLATAQAPEGYVRLGR